MTVGRLGVIASYAVADEAPVLAGMSFEIDVNLIQVHCNDGRVSGVRVSGVLVVNEIPWSTYIPAARLSEVPDWVRQLVDLHGGVGDLT